MLVRGEGYIEKYVEVTLKIHNVPSSGGTQMRHKLRVQADLVDTQDDSFRLLNVKEITEFPRRDTLGYSVDVYGIKGCYGSLDELYQAIDDNEPGVQFEQFYIIGNVAYAETYDCKSCAELEGIRCLLCN